MLICDGERGGWGVGGGGGEREQTDRQPFRQTQRERG